MTSSKSMCARRRRIGGHQLVALVACVAVANVVGPVAAEAASRYPDLRMLAPTKLRLMTATVNGEVHHRLHFETRPSNFGEGALEINRTPTPSGIADLTQRVYEEPVGFRDEPLGSAVFGTTDLTFPVPNIARYEVWGEREYRRAEKRAFIRDAPLYYRQGVSHCVADSAQMSPNEISVARYQCRKTEMGISVGWSDIEGWFESFQSVDFGTTLIPDGDYVLRVIVDPDNILFESDGKADSSREGQVVNSAISYFRLVGGRLAGIE